MGSAVAAVGSRPGSMAVRRAHRKARAGGGGGGGADRAPTGRGPGSAPCPPPSPGSPAAAPVPLCGAPQSRWRDPPAGNWEAQRRLRPLRTPSHRPGTATRLVGRRGHVEPEVVLGVRHQPGPPLRARRGASAPGRESCIEQGAEGSKDSVSVRSAAPCRRQCWRPKVGS